MTLFFRHQNVSSTKQEATEMRKPRGGNEEEQQLVNEASRRQISAAEPRQTANSGSWFC
jgi:hypothetical protein